MVDLLINLIYELLESIIVLLLWFNQFTYVFSLLWCERVECSKSLQILYHFSIWFIIHEEIINNRIIIQPIHDFSNIQFIIMGIIRFQKHNFSKILNIIITWRLLISDSGNSIDDTYKYQQYFLHWNRLTLIEIKD